MAMSESETKISGVCDDIKELLIHKNVLTNKSKAKYVILDALIIYFVRINGSYNIKMDMDEMCGNIYVYIYVCMYAHRYMSTI